MATAWEGVSPADQQDTCEIEATVVTGFESQAKEEILEKLGTTSATSRGKVNFHLNVRDCKKILELSSIDNATVILTHFDHFQFADNEESVMQQMRELVPEVNWELGLKVWHNFFNFPYPISSHPKCMHNCDLPDKPALQSETNAALLSDVDKQENKCSSSPTISGNRSDTVTNTAGELESATSNPESLKESSWDPELPAFRVTCYRTGKHVFQSPAAAANFGSEINNYFGWNVSMKKFDIEVILNIEQDHIYISLALTRESLHRRNLTSFGPTTLRPTIAYNMLRFCRIKTGEVVCDPMCGGGSIPVEAVLNWPSAVHLCGDIHEQASPRTKENIDAINAKRREAGIKCLPLSVFRWDACKLPLQDGSVDVFITDLPFGKRSGSKLRNCHLYPRVLKEMARVCKLETGRACLLTQDKKNLVKSLMSVESLWRRGPTLGINIGGLAAGVFLLHRTTRKYMTQEELFRDRQLRDEHRLQKQAKQQQHKQVSDNCT